jgi:hypothetical protein
MSTASFCRGQNPLCACEQGLQQASPTQIHPLDSVKSRSTMRCSKPGHRASVPIYALRGPGPFNSPTFLDDSRRSNKVKPSVNQQTRSNSWNFSRIFGCRPCCPPWSSGFGRFSPVRFSGFPLVARFSLLRSFPVERRSRARAGGVALPCHSHPTLMQFPCNPHATLALKAWRMGADISATALDATIISQ